MCKDNKFKNISIIGIDYAKSIDNTSRITIINLSK